MFSRLSAFATEAMSGLLHPELEDSSPAHALASNIHRDQQSITRLRLFLATDAVLSSRIKDWPEKYVNGKPFEFHIWDAARFHRAFESATGRDELKIDFREFMAEGIPCLEASQTGEEYKAYLCVIPASYRSLITFGNIPFQPEFPQTSGSPPLIPGRIPGSGSPGDQPSR